MKLVTDLLRRLCDSAVKPDLVPRTLLVVAHPDDEVVGAGSRLPRWRDAGLCLVTDGAPRTLGEALCARFPTRTDYARLRREEMDHALAITGMDRGQVRELGLVDQEASLHLAALVRHLVEEFTRFEVEAVVTHPYEGGHPDHDAAAFAVATAVRLLIAAGRSAPVIFEMAGYHGLNGALTVQEFLPGREVRTWRHVLSAEERVLKRRLFGCYRSQRADLNDFVLQYEQFREAPRYNFMAPPHSGRLYYELFDWGMSGRRWRTLAQQALQELGLAEESGCPFADELDPDSREVASIRKAM